MAALVLVLSMTAPAAHAQVGDTTRAAAPVDTAARPIVVPPGPPLSPGRAFVRSLFIPGYGQAGLERSVAAGVYAFIEVAALGMARKSALDLREARNAPQDSTVLRYQRDPTTGELVLDAQTGQPIPAAYTRTDLRDRVRARKTHYEDWIAILIFNHLFSAADAYVAAHLWDFPARVGASVTPARDARVSASIAW